MYLTKIILIPLVRYKRTYHITRNVWLVTVTYLPYYTFPKVCYRWPNVNKLNENQISFNPTDAVHYINYNMLNAWLAINIICGHVLVFHCVDVTTKIGIAIHVGCTLTYTQVFFALHYFFCFYTYVSRIRVYHGKVYIGTDIPSSFFLGRRFIYVCVGTCPVRVYVYTGACANVRHTPFRKISIFNYSNNIKHTNTVISALCVIVYGCHPGYTEHVLLWEGYYVCICIINYRFLCF